MVDSALREKHEGFPPSSPCSHAEYERATADSSNSTSPVPKRRPLIPAIIEIDKAPKKGSEPREDPVLQAQMAECARNTALGMAGGMIWGGYRGLKENAHLRTTYAEFKDIQKPYRCTIHFIKLFFTKMLLCASALHVCCTAADAQNILISSRMPMDLALAARDAASTAWKLGFLAGSFTAVRFYLEYQTPKLTSHFKVNVHGGR
jgi:hypothetical protein